MSESDWQDPFEPEDTDAQERERRRRERAQRRRARAARREGRAQQGRELAQRGRKRGRELARRGLELGQRGRALVQRRGPSMEALRKRRPSTDVLRQRRIAGLLALLAIAAVGVAGVAVIASSVGGSDAEAPPPLETISVTIPEGLDRSQIAEVARDAGLRGDYEQATRRSKLLDLKGYEAGKPESLEGFLFPDTYELEKGARVEELVKRQLETFEQRISEVDMDYASSKNLTPYDVLVIGSMIEREVQVPEERELVAAVVYNRLSAGMPLGIDATIRFATGNTERPIKESDLEIDSPYNTYENTGLPPGPIGNPGLDSIEAAAHPARVDYLYYVIKPGTCGEHAFTASESEFYDLSAEYDTAREAAGGKSPTEC